MSTVLAEFNSAITHPDSAIGKSGDEGRHTAKDKLSKIKVKQFQRDVKGFKGTPRVWFVFCNTSKMEEDILLLTIHPLGQQLDHARQTGAFTYLYDLSLPPGKKSARILIANCTFLDQVVRRIRRD